MSRKLISYGTPSLKTETHLWIRATQVCLYIGTYLDNGSEVFAVDVVVRLEEHFSEATLAYWVVLGIELVETMEGVPILTEK